MLQNQTKEVPNSELKSQVQELISIYGKAWETQDSSLILSVFTTDALYHERVFHAPMIGHAAIKKYWEEKVCHDQANIQFTLNQLFIDRECSTAIAEWEAKFDDRVKGVRKHMKEIAVLEIRDGKIAHLREYWSSEPLANL